MTALWRNFWREDSGLILSAEVVIILTISVLGMVVGLVNIQNALLGEFTDLGLAFNSLNQSYSTPSYRGCWKFWGPTSYSSGSRFVDILEDSRIYVDAPVVGLGGYHGLDVIGGTGYYSGTQVFVDQSMCAGFGATSSGVGIQVETLSVAQIQALTVCQFRSLSASQISSLTALQIQALTSAQIQELSLTQIQALTSIQIQALTALQIQSLTAAQIPSLAIVQIQAFTASQVQSLTIVQLHSLIEAQVQALTPAQTELLSPSQGEALRAARQAPMPVPHPMPILHPVP